MGDEPMIGKLLIDKLGNGFNMCYLKLDRHSLDALIRGETLGVGFYLDDCEHLEAYQRSYLKLSIGLNIDLEQAEKNFKENSARDGMVDKTYFLNEIKEIEQKLARLGINTKFLTLKDETI